MGKSPREGIYHIFSFCQWPLKSIRRKSKTKKVRGIKQNTTSIIRLSLTVCVPEHVSVGAECMAVKIKRGENLTVVCFATKHKHTTQLSDIVNNLL